MAMDGIENDLFQMYSFDSSNNNLEDYSPKKFRKVFENLLENIPVTFDTSSYKNSSDDNSTDYDNPGQVFNLASVCEMSALKFYYIGSV